MKFRNKQEVHDYLKNSKIYAGDKGLEIQKILYEYEFKWLVFKSIYDVPFSLSTLPFLWLNSEYIGTFISYNGFCINDFKELSIDDILSIEIEPEKVIRDGKVAVCYCTKGEGLSRYNHIYPELLFSPKIVKMIEDERQEEITSEWIEKELGIKVVDIGFCDFLTIKWIPEGEQFQITEFDGCEDIWLLKELNNVFTA